MSVEIKTQPNDTPFQGLSRVIAQEFPDTNLDIVERGHYDLTPPSEPVGFGHDLVVAHQPIDPKRETLVAVIGVGYVGQHLVDIFSRAFDVLGYDVSQTRIHQVEQLFKTNARVQFTTSPGDIRRATHFLIAVPTLLLPDKRIDSSYLRNALGTVASHGATGSTIIIESSVAVGMTREFLGPLAAERGFYAGMSPERVDPGRTTPAAEAIPKIISGLDDIVPGSLNSIRQLYSRVFDHVVPVSTPEVAEMTKLYENCQRMVCIAYANEMADACIPHGIDPFEVCRAAATKPFGYLPFVPGAGVGGHCIPINPHYLLSNNDFPILRVSSARMSNRPFEMATRIVADLCGRVPTDYKPSVLVVGIGFKLGQSHLANSPGLELVKCLILTGRSDVAWADPLVPQSAVPQVAKLEDDEWSEASLDTRFDLIVVVLRQIGLDFSVLERLRNARVKMLCP
ncbi:hypothetical protein C2857_006859 [Epichloe festucae Fl1]|uniref:Nucleotide sugar dehydrogenase n=1 Tax=Epichloe festucae (strain Fl1) TaxID=877507 RepID=A0A7S9PWE1_EPIFF|nr:hypothetical protein C2857_006859 [Epichloe festucae Fl1]